LELITWRKDNIRIDILENFSKGGQILKRNLSKLNGGRLLFLIDALDIKAKSSPLGVVAWVAKMEDNECSAKLTHQEETK
jgi:hypothetical protein